MAEVTLSEIPKDLLKLVATSAKEVDLHLMDLVYDKGKQESAVKRAMIARKALAAGYDLRIVAACLNRSKSTIVTSMKNLEEYEARGCVHKKGGRPWKKEAK